MPSFLEEALAESPKPTRPPAVRKPSFLDEALARPPKEEPAPRDPLQRPSILSMLEDEGPQPPTLGSVVGSPVMTGVEKTLEPFNVMDRSVRAGLRTIAGPVLKGETLSQSQQAAQRGFEEKRGMFNELKELFERDADKFLPAGATHEEFPTAKQYAKGFGTAAGLFSENVAMAGTVPAIAGALKQVGKLRGVTKAAQAAVEMARKPIGTKFTPDEFRIPGTDIVETTVSESPLMGSAPGKLKQALAATERGLQKGERFVGKQLQYRYGQPEAYQALAEDNLNSLHKIIEQSTDLSKSLAEGLSKDQRVQLGAAIRNGGRSTDPILAERAQQARSLLDDVGEQAVKAGLLSRQVYEANKGSYMARFYELYENPEKGKTFLAEMFGTSPPTRLQVDRFLKMNKNLDEVQRAQMGEILDPAYAVAKGSAQTRTAVTNAQFFSKVASNPEWASTDHVPGWTQLTAKSKGGIHRLGDLEGKWVEPSIAEDINQSFKMSSGLWKTYVKSLSKWKEFKTVDNPGTHFGNLIGNTMLADLGGLSPARLDIYGRAIKELAQGKGEFFQEAKDLGMFRRGNVTQEFQELLQSFIKEPGTTWTDKMPAILAWMAKAPGKIHGGMKAAYQKEEELFKLAKYIHARTDLGMKPSEAFADAQKWLIDYSKVTPFIKGVRNTAMPFVTFPYKSLPLLAEAAAKTPFRVTKYIVALQELQNNAIDNLKLSEAEWEEVKRTMPGYMRSGQFLLLPTRDQHGRLQFINLTNKLLWGDVMDAPREPGVASLTNKNPYVSLLDMARNRDWRGKEIWDERDTPTEKFKKWASRVHQLVLPNLSPPIPGLTEGGYNWKAMMDAINQRDFYGETPTVGQSVARQVGMRVHPLPQERALKTTGEQYRKELSERRFEEQDLNRRQDLSKEMRERLLKIVDRKRQEQLKEGLLRR